MTSWVYAYDSLLMNGYLLWTAHRFFVHRDNTTARKLFFATLAFLPVQMLLMILHKNTDPSPLLVQA